VYLERLEKSGLDSATVDELLREHLIAPEHLRGADFDGFFRARWDSVFATVESVMGKAPIRDYHDGDAEVDEYEGESDDPEGTDDEEDAATGAG